MSGASRPTTGADLLRSVGLLADGPVGWVRRVPATGPGVYIVELTSPLPNAPIELTRVGKWIERVPDLRLDGDRPTSKALAARLASFWHPDQVVVFIGSAGSSVGGRIAALQQTRLGDRRPYAGAHWLATLREAALASARVWWASSDAAEEYEDALLTAFAEAAEGAADGAGTDLALVLPWAVLRRPTGERRAHGITSALLPEPVAATPPTTRRTIEPEAGPAPRTAVGGVRAPRSRPATTGGSGKAAPGGARHARPPDTVELSAEGFERLQQELHTLRTVERPVTVKRVAAARELGDLKENAEYHAAREQLGFIDGRIAALEARSRLAVVVEAPVDGTRAVIGSTVIVEVDGEQLRYRLVGSSEADPAAGRISTSSPVGRALLGHGPGDDVEVATPAGSTTYRIVEIG
jgi:transcription elongation factor GreA